MNLEFVPSPLQERPGLMIRDPYRYSDMVIIVPPPLVPCLELFDGRQTDLDLRAILVKLTGQLEVGELENNLMQALSSSGFLEDEFFARLKEQKQGEFAAAPRREPSHAGGAYPEEIGPLRETMRGYMDGAGPDPQVPAGLLGIAAPHVSPAGGWRSYQAAYRALPAGYRDRTFVVLGTSHYGEPERFGMTRKPYATPIGECRIDLPLVDWLEEHARPAIRMEDYCHAIEHSIEFQVLFLQYLYGPDIRIVPILCGAYARSINNGGPPETDENVRRFLDTLGEMAAREQDRLCWVLGIDMAHMGRRYYDTFSATADQGPMQAVAYKDQGRIDCVAAGDSAGFWSLVQEHRDDLKWCGSSPLYTFLKAVPQARGKLLRYEQWNIDPQSVVSFAGMSFVGDTT